MLPSEVDVTVDSNMQNLLYKKSRPTDEESRAGENGKEIHDNIDVSFTGSDTENLGPSTAETSASHPLIRPYCCRYRSLRLPQNIQDFLC